MAMALAFGSELGHSTNINPIFSSNCSNYAFLDSPDRQKVMKQLIGCETSINFIFLVSSWRGPALYKEGGGGGGGGGQKGEWHFR